MGLTDSCGSRRAYSGWQGESVTRGDRRRRELEIRETVPAARLPARIDGAGSILDLLVGVQHRALCIGHKRLVVLVCSPRDKQEFSVVSNAGEVYFWRLVKRSTGFSFLAGGAARTEW